MVWRAQKRFVCHRCLDLPHADSGHVKVGGCEQELSVNGTRDLKNWDSWDEDTGNSNNTPHV